MTCKQLLHLHHILDHTDLIRLDIITAFVDNSFPVEKWDKEGLLEGMVSWAEDEHGKYNNLSDGGWHDFDDFLYCVAEVLANANCDLNYPMNVDMDEVYGMLDSMN